MSLPQRQAWPVHLANRIEIDPIFAVNIDRSVTCSDHVRIGPCSGIAGPVGVATATHDGVTDDRARQNVSRSDIDLVQRVDVVRCRKIAVHNVFRLGFDVDHAIRGIDHGCRRDTDFDGDICAARL